MARTKKVKAMYIPKGSGFTGIYSHYVLPASKANYFQIHDQMTWAMDAICEKEKQSNYWNREYITAALAAIGITQPK